MSIAGEDGLAIYAGHNGKSRCETHANNARHAVQANCKRYAGHAGKTGQQVMLVKQAMELDDLERYAFFFLTQTN